MQGSGSVQIITDPELGGPKTKGSGSTTLLEGMRKTFLTENIVFSIRKFQNGKIVFFFLKAPANQSPFISSSMDLNLIFYFPLTIRA
jgi:hypothetical protein